ncbi:MAG: PAS domain S-box protein, partial [Gemmatimonadota bacterium]
MVEPPNSDLETNGELALEAEECRRGDEDMRERAALRESEEIFRSIVQTSAVGVARTNPEGRFVLTNAAYQQMLGYTAQELNRLSVEDVTHPDDWPRNRDLFEGLIRREIPSFEIEKRYRRKDGNEIWVRNSVSAVFDAVGRPLFVHAISQDITEQKRIREELEQREILLREAQEIAHVGNWLWNIERDQILWSEELYRIYGFEPGTIELDYGTFLSCVHPDDRERVDRMVREAYASGEPFDYLHGIVRSDGEVRTIHARGRVVRDDAGRAIRMIGTGEDVTERVQVERELRRSGESYRMLAENVQEMIIRFSPEGRITYASPAARTILGYEPAEVVGREGREFLHPEDLERVVAAHREMLHGAEPPAVLSRLLHRDGHPVWMETTTRAVRDPDSGQIESIVAVSRDVTESVRAARTSRLLHSVAVAANEAGSAREAVQTVLGLVCEHAGWPVGHAYVPARSSGGKIGPLDIWHLDDPARHARLRAVIESTVLPEGKGLLGRVLDNGAVEWVRDVTSDPSFLRSTMARQLGVRAAFAFPIRSGDETIAVLEFFAEQPEEPDRGVVDLLENVVAQLAEVLRRKQAEQALRASEERFRALAESANDAFVTVDGRGIVVHCNQSLQRIFGYSCEEICGKPIERLLAKRQTDGGGSGFRPFLDRGEHLLGRMIEVTGRRKSGEELPLEMSLAAWETEEGSFVTGILRDVSSRKEAEDALAEKMKELARSNAELGLFTYVASHDLREPLRTVGSNVQLLARNLSDR